MLAVRFRSLIECNSVSGQSDLFRMCFDSLKAEKKITKKSKQEKLRRASVAQRQKLLNGSAFKR